MRKVVLTDGSGKWFDIDSAKAFEAGSTTAHNGLPICRATDSASWWQTLYITRKGSFILSTYVVRADYIPPEPYEERDESVVEVDIKKAVQWLISNGHQEEVKKMDEAREEADLEL